MGMWLASLPHTWALVGLLGSQAWTTVLWGAPSGRRDHGGMGVGKSDHKMGLAPLRVLGEGEGVPMFKRPIHGARVSGIEGETFGGLERNRASGSCLLRSHWACLLHHFHFLIYFIFLTYFIFYSSLLFSFFFVPFSLLVTRLAGSWFPGRGLDLSSCCRCQVWTTGLTENLGPQGSSSWALPEVLISTRKIIPPSFLQIPVLDASGQTTSKKGMQFHPSKKKKKRK